MHSEVYRELEVVRYPQGNIQKDYTQFLVASLLRIVVEDFGCLGGMMLVELDQEDKLQVLVDFRNSTLAFFHHMDLMESAAMQVLLGSAVDDLGLVPHMAAVDVEIEKSCKKVVVH